MFALQHKSLKYFGEKTYDDEMANNFAAESEMLFVV